MIEGYSVNLCPVIEIKDLERAMLSLPTRDKVNKDTKSDTFTVFLDGNEEKFVLFDWDEKANKWKVRNRIVIDIGVNLRSFCDKCNSVREYVVNLQVTKKKCKVCGTVTDI